MKKTKEPKSLKVFKEICFWVFALGIPLGIWIDDYRWKLISTSLFAFILALITTYNDDKEKGI